MKTAKIVNIGDEQYVILPPEIKIDEKNIQFVDHPMGVLIKTKEDKSLETTAPDANP